LSFPTWSFLSSPTWSILFFQYRPRMSTLYPVFNIPACRTASRTLFCQPHTPAIAHVLDSVVKMRPVSGMPLLSHTKSLTVVKTRAAICIPLTFHMSADSCIPLLLPHMPLTMVAVHTKLPHLLLLEQCVCVCLNCLHKGRVQRLTLFAI
jgi:hypothetical protein